MIQITEKKVISNQRSLLFIRLGQVLSITLQTSVNNVFISTGVKREMQNVSIHTVIFFHFFFFLLCYDLKSVISFQSKPWFKSVTCEIFISLFFLIINRRWNVSLEIGHFLITRDTRFKRSYMSIEKSLRKNEKYCYCYFKLFYHYIS